MRGENVVALLDRAQADALDSLPFADDLEVVARSSPMLGSLLCAVDGRLDEPAMQELQSAFLGLERSEGGRELLDALRIASFGSLDGDALTRAEEAFAAEGSGTR